jgi:23S rRNA pseudouridine1911/1915/1917 synthase
MRWTCVHEDDTCWCIDKPAGLVVHPAPGNWSGTLLNGLLGARPRAPELPRAGIVHRLDKDTSGLMVVARTARPWTHWCAMIAAREVRASTWRWRTGPGRARRAARRGGDRARPAQPPAHGGGRSAAPSGQARGDAVQLLQAGRRRAALRRTLETGRTHQIRVHWRTSATRCVADASTAGRPRPACSARRCMPSGWLRASVTARR